MVTLKKTAPVIPRMSFIYGALAPTQDTFVGKPRKLKLPKPGLANRRAAWNWAVLKSKRQSTVLLERSSRSDLPSLPVGHLDVLVGFRVVGEFHFCAVPE
jgi:hypothetical protein